MVRSPEEGRAAVREHVEKGVDHIKLYPGGAYSFGPNGEDQYATTYPLPVLQAIIDEAHKLGKKTGCHVFGGEGLQNAITAHCDTIEHGYGLKQPQLDQMAAAGIAYRVVEHGPVRNLAEAAAARGVAVPDVVKTIVVRLAGDQRDAQKHIRGNRIAGGGRPVHQ